MKDQKNTLLKWVAVLFTAVGVFSCQDQIVLEGEGIISGEIFETNKATFDVFASHKSVSAVQTNKLPIYQLGNFNHPVYGKTSA